MICQLCPLCGADLAHGKPCDCGTIWTNVELPPAADAGGQTDGEEE